MNRRDSDTAIALSVVVLALGFLHGGVLGQSCGWALLATGIMLCVAEKFAYVLFMVALIVATTADSGVDILRCAIVAACAVVVSGMLFSRRPVQ